MDLEQARKASRAGAYAAFFSGTMTILIFAVATGSNASGMLGIWNDPTVVVDIAIIFACAIGMLRCSRAAAIFMTLYWIFAKSYIYLETGQAQGLVLSVIFFIFFVRAIKGSFTYHKLRKEEDPEYRAAPKWYYYTGIPAMVVLTGLLGLGLMSMTGVVPSIEVLGGYEVAPEDRDLLVGSGVLYPDEEIKYFYSWGLLSIMEGGEVLTDRAVVTYYTDENGQVLIYEMPYSQIRSVDLVEPGGTLSDALYRVSGFDEDNWIMIQLSQENDGHIRFIEAIHEQIRRARIEAEEAVSK